MKREFDLLGEEKLYWQTQALDARDLVEKHAAATRLAREDLARVEENAVRQREIDKCHYARDIAAQKLIKVLAGAAGITLPAFNLPLATPVFIDDLAEFAEAEVAKKVADEMPEYFHVAWHGNGGLYLDVRALNKEDNAKSKAIFARGEKVKLYARVPK